MFDALWSLIGPLGNSILKGINLTWAFLNGLFRAQWLIMFTVAGAFFSTWLTVTHLMGLMGGWMDQAMTATTGVGGSGGGVGELIGFCNYIFPLQESLSFIAIWFEIQAFLLAYRLLKSWIPTVSG
jgi:hypothetical protein